MKNRLHKTVAFIFILVVVIFTDVYARGGGGRGGGGGSRGGGSRSGGSRGGGSHSSAYRSSAARSSAARSGRGTVRYSGNTGSQYTPTHNRNSVRNPQIQNNGHNSSRNGAVVAGVAAGAAVGAISAGDKINNRRDEIANGSAQGVQVFGPEVAQGTPGIRGNAAQGVPRVGSEVANGVQVIGPDVKGNVRNNVRSERRITSPDGVNLSRDQAREKLSENGRKIIDKLPPEAERNIIDRVDDRRDNYDDWDNNCYYHYGSYWYRPLYYDDYLYYETVPAPVDDLIDLNEADLKKVVIDGREYYMYGGAYYIKLDGGYLRVDPFAR